LDARYSLPKYISHTRNLIVASHYGLSVHGRSEVFGRVNNIPSVLSASRFRDLIAFFEPAFFVVGHGLHVTFVKSIRVVNGA
jgi:hypothetical protein